MADNISLPPSGVTALTDDCTTGHAQIVKLAIATDGSATLIPSDGTDGLLVNLGTNNDVAVSSIAAGNNNIGDVDVATVPAPLNVTGNGAAATALRVTLANDTTGKVIVSDGTNNVDIDVAPTDGETNGGKRLLHTEAWLWGYNGTSWDRLRSDTTNGLDVDVTRVPTDPFGANADAASATGSISAKLRFIASTGIPVTGTVTVGSHAVTNAGTFAVQDSEKVADNGGFTDGTTKVMPAGFIYDDTPGTALTENDAGAARMTQDRKLIVALGDSGANFVKGGGSKTDATAQSLMAASGDANITNYLCWVTVYNSSATNTAVEIRDGTTTVVAVIPAPAYGGAVVNFANPIRMTANTATNAYAQTGVTTLYMYGGGYKAR